MNRTLIALAFVATLALAACTSSEDLRDRAGELDAASQRIVAILDANPPGSVEQSDLVASIVDALPEAWQEASADALTTVGDVRAGATDLAALLATKADEFEAQADAAASEAENAIFLGINAGEMLLGTNGLLAILGGIIFRKKRQADRASRDNAAILEDIVTSIESSKVIREAISNGGGDDLRKSMSAATQKAVKDIKAKT
jgi:hypothetical protein